MQFVKERHMNIVTFADKESLVMTVITMEWIRVVKKKCNFTVAKLELHLSSYKRECCKSP